MKEGALHVDNRDGRSAPRGGREGMGGVVKRLTQSTCLAHLGSLYLSALIRNKSTMRNTADPAKHPCGPVL